MTEESRQLDPGPLSPVGFKIISALLAQGPSTPAALEGHLGSRPGLLDGELRELADAGYVELKTGSSGPGPEGAYHLTGEGRAAFSSHVDWLRRALTQAE